MNFIIAVRSNEMSEPSLEERLAALESRVAALENATLGRPPSRDAWKSVIGMFADDPEIELIHAEARRIREETALRHERNSTPKIMEQMEHQSK
jgi:hypothetical protein